MFSATGKQTTSLLRRRLKSAALLVAGFVVANGLALFALNSAARAEPAIDPMTTASIEPAMRLANMLAAPDIGTASTVTSQMTLFGVMLVALFAMAAGSAAFLNGLKHDYSARPDSTRQH